MEEERKLGSPEEKDASPAPETKPAASASAGSREAQKHRAARRSRADSGGGARSGSRK